MLSSQHGSSSAFLSLLCKSSNVRPRSGVSDKCPGRRRFIVPRTSPMIAIVVV
uniref:Uncharacterized protein n=1 Tax=Ciona intestinalis TaxID=7719 RepID=H2XP44_CIOIN